ncbi:hypothetical protein [Flavobacterium algoritolerans]|uniref:STAS domain-containing protein n=1 Tax=Flavobacterium algoritolerans TaxID=3041254 RepID=A0ABT6V8I7_9FLAO|nr:hypothetical protein [Flavobacterium algoritolerans]MDI5894140.1 hypothetical protein [Flavobacterium algoritolerans]
MANLTIKTPNNGNPIAWFNFINNSKSKLNSDIDTLIVDFNDLTYLDTDDLVLLGCLMDLFNNEKIKIQFINGRGKLTKHLRGIKFKKYWSNGFNRDNFTETHNKNTLCLWHISPTMITSYSEYAKKYFERTFFKGKDLLPIATNMSEIFNNIFDHSKSPVNGYIITQYSPVKKLLSFSVCDFGVGIANSLNNYYDKKGIDRVSDSQAIKNSLETGVSSFSTLRNKGFGLSNVLDFTENFKGLLTIYSNNGYLLKEFNDDYYLKETNLNFSGTLIKVEISTLEFDEIDQENDVYEI